MKIILIDPEKQTVTEENIESGLKSIYKTLECTTVECPYIDCIEETDTIYCDKEALLNPHKIKGGFMMPGWLHPIIGKSMIVGTDEEGDDKDCETSVDAFDNIIWISKERALEHADNIPDPIFIF